MHGAIGHPTPKPSCRHAQVLAGHCSPARQLLYERIEELVTIHHINFFHSHSTVNVCTNCVQSFGLYRSTS